MVKAFKFLFILGGITLTSSAAFAAATCDQYPGDTIIYGGLTSSIKSNILLIIDTSGSMKDPVIGATYDPNATYNDSLKCGSNRKETCISGEVYSVTTSNKDITRTDTKIATLNVSDTICGSLYPQSSLKNNGQFIGKLNSKTLKCDATAQSTIYQTGHYINFLETSGTLIPKIEVARNVVRNLIATTTGVNFGAMIFRSDDEGATFIESTVGSTTYITDIKNMDLDFSVNVTNRDALLSIFSVPAYNADGSENKTSPIFPSGTTPLAESLYEASQYFKGGITAFNNTIGLTGSPLKYSSPITSSCQKNYIILITDGISTADNNAVLDSKDFCPSGIAGCKGDYDGDKMELDTTSCGVVDDKGKADCKGWWHSLDDVAKYIYDKDLLPEDSTPGKEYTIGTQNISTYTIGFGEVGGNAAAVSLLESAGVKGHGASYLAGNQSALSSALAQIMSLITSIDSSFVAPVVPVSPDNRTYNSNRIYMGFFKPINQAPWEGNLKKYGLDTNNNIIDKENHFANWSDVNGDGFDDNSTNTTLPPGATNGSFKSTSISYWSTSADAGDVNSGGAGDILANRIFSTDPRKIYTYTGTNTSLIDASNLFPMGATPITNKPTSIPTNAAVTNSLLGVADDTSRNKLLDFIHGFDAYNSDSTKTTLNRGWIFGDINHSKPLVVNYATYHMPNPNLSPDPNAVNESSCSINKSIIYVGSNDGMLHAIKDCDGSESWAFIPPEVMINLKEIPGQNHTYTVDASPAVYMYDANKDGNITTNTTEKDKVILMIGLRRGGGPGPTPAAAAKGSYYALDVTDPAAPKYLWSLSNATTGFSELGESWAEPKIVKIKVGTVSKMVALIPGGYDNMNEDSRYGAVQTFTETGTISNSTSGAGNSTSTGVSTPTSTKKGRGIYAIEIATLSSSGVPTIPDPTTPPTPPSKVWSVTYGANTSYSTAPATDANMKFSIVSEITTLDVDGNGSVDRLYATDLGGNLWRFDVGAITTSSSGTGNLIFSANPDSGTDIGRKLFFKPVATLESTVTNSARGSDAFIFMGSGDREHPTNTAVEDRIYAVRDKGQTTIKYESNLQDFTTDPLQTTTITSGVGSVEDILSKLNATTNYGWYIKLDRKQDSPNQALNAGEKVLASPALSNKIVYFTTFTPGASTNTDPCKPSNLGTSRLYTLNYATGEAVMNYCDSNTNNKCDSNFITNTGANNDTASLSNRRAQAKVGGDVLQRSDRSKVLGSGIASGAVKIGDKVFVGAGGAIVTEKTLKGGQIINMYWGQK